MENEFVYVKVRLEEELHKELKVIANSEKRSMVFLLNEAVKLLIENRKSAKAWNQQVQKNLARLPIKRKV